MHARILKGIVGIALALAALPAARAQDLSAVEIKAVPIAGSVHMLTGAGGNLGLSAGADGVFLIDDQFAPLTDKIRAAVAKIQPGPIRFVVNTHWHFDHTGGNENMGKAGALLVAHDNVRQRMSVEQFIQALDRHVPASPLGALPVVTFSDDVTFHMNGEDIHVFHVPHAHTDGDSMVHFPKADVMHLGDVFFNGLYPFIDLSSGGSVDGVIAAVDRALEIAGPKTKLIPGHGPLAGRTELTAYRDLLAKVRSRIETAVEAGKTLDDVKQEKPTAEYDATWGGGFMKPDVFVSIVYQSVSARK
jgi:glyoxylase-like metal-dependent hydrolase (beta-lactamase superfamily II)